MRSAMRGSQSILTQVGRLLLAIALCTGTFVSSAVGAGLVLHQHGLLGAHLHILGQSDFFANAAWSSQFGHPSDSTIAVVSASEPVQVVAILKTASKLGWTPGSEDDGKSLFVSTIKSLSADQTGPAEQQAAALPSNLSAAWTGPSAPISIVLRSHTLLI